MIDNAFLRIQTFPESGRVASDQDPPVRAYHLEHHTIVHRRDPDAVTILSALDLRQLRR